MDAQQTAAHLITYIERETRYLLNQMREVIEVILHGQSTRLDFNPSPLRAKDLERMVQVWRDALPDNPEVKARVAHGLGGRYPIAAQTTPRLWAALSLDTPPVIAAYQSLYGATPQEHLSTLADEASSSLSMFLISHDIQALRDALEYQFLPGGHVLFEEGAPADSLYVIGSGRVRIQIREGELQRLVAERGRYDMVGEMALLTESPRNATVYAIRDTELWRISRGVFEQVAEKYPRIMLQITRNLSQRLALTTQGKGNYQRDHVRTLALIPAGESHFDIATFAQQLSEALAAHGRVSLVNSARVDEAIGTGVSDSLPNSIEESRLVGWLNENEFMHQFTLYIADPTLSEWTKRCLRQADRVLLIGAAGGQPALNPIEKMLFDTYNPDLRKELVLIHPESTALPSGTHHWLAARPVANHHHIIPSRPDHMGRLARFLTGRPVALVLSGGTVRSFAHIGVLRVLAEQGIPVDAICGTSSGSIVSAQYAMGWDSFELERRNRELFKSARQLIDFTIPYTSFIAAGRFNALLQEVMGEIRVEDLWLKYFCTSSDLTDFQIRSHTRGLLWRAVRASCAVPGALPPLIEDGHILVDGGLTSNLPVTQMLEQIGSGLIVLVNVVPEFYPDDARFNFGDSLPFWKVLNATLNPFGGNVTLPNIGEIFRRSAECSARGLHLIEAHRADLYIQPDLGDINPTDVTRIDFLIERGMEAARDKAAGWSWQKVG